MMRRGETRDEWLASEGVTECRRISGIRCVEVLGNGVESRKGRWRPVTLLLMTFLRWYSRLPDVPEVTEEGLSVIVPEVPCFTFSATVVTKDRIINGGVRGGRRGRRLLHVWSVIIEGREIRVSCSR